MVFGNFSWRAGACLLSLMVSAGPFRAADGTSNTELAEQLRLLREEVAALRAQVTANDQRHGQEVAALREQLSLAQEASALLTAAPEPQAGLPGQTGAAPPPRYMDVSLSGLFAAGASTATEAHLLELEPGGHDPKNRGFTIQNVELSFQAVVDPYFNANAHLVTQLDENGETVFELEEAYITTRALPGGLSVKAGTFFSEFGRHNPRHPHAWEFADTPVVNGRILGPEALRGPGLRVSWLAPLPWYSDIQLGVLNPRSETAFSFLNAEAPAAEGEPLVKEEVKAFDDLVYTFRWLNGFGFEHSDLNLGVSWATGPNTTGEHTRTRITAADLYWKWKAPLNDKGFPFVSVQAEWMKRGYDAGDDTGITFDDTGYYAQLLWGFKRNWVAGVRYDDAWGSDADPLDPWRGDRQRLSGVLSWYPSEFSMLRLQVNQDWADFLPEEQATSIFLQFGFTIGAHGAHTF